MGGGKRFLENVREFKQIISELNIFVLWSLIIAFSDE